MLISLIWSLIPDKNINFLLYITTPIYFCVFRFAFVYKRNLATYICNGA